MSRLKDSMSIHAMKVDNITVTGAVKFDDVHLTNILLVRILERLETLEKKTAAYSNAGIAELQTKIDTLQENLYQFIRTNFVLPVVT